MSDDEETPNVEPTSQPQEQLVTIQVESKKPPIPLMYRVMKKAPDGFPKVADEDLGVKEGYDVHVGSDRIVAVGEEGMSVYSHWRKISTNRKPRRVGGRADNEWFCFKIGEGPFQGGPVTEHLEFLRDKEKKKHHGIIRPAQPVLLDEYRAHLAETRERWLEDETNV